MTEFSSQSEFDDELLSAYLDDELSPEERARVDARLAADPAARRLLEDLQTASHALRNMPRQAVGEDLRESVLRRIESTVRARDAQPASAAASAALATNGAPSSSPTSRDTLPRITIGQTRRGWVWASLAVAAALLIMVLQPGEPGADRVPQVAANRQDQKPDGVAQNKPVDVPELRAYSADSSPEALSSRDLYGFANGDAMPEASAPPPPSAAAAAPNSATLSDQSPPSPSELTGLAAVLDGQTADGSRQAPNEPAVALTLEPVPPGAAVAESSRAVQLGVRMIDASGAPIAVNGPTPAPDTFAERPMADLSESVPGTEFGAQILLQPEAGRAASGSFAKDAAQAAPSENTLVIVHVTATPDALRNNTFDALLLKSGIQLEEVAVTALQATPPRVADEALADNTADRKMTLRREVRGGEQIDVSPNEDVILVAAPQATIESFLADLKQDQSNYVGLAVEGAAAKPALNEQKSLAFAEQPTDKLATDLALRFNRGVAPPPDVQVFRRRYRGIDYKEKPSSADDGLVGGFGGGRDSGLGGLGAGGSPSPPQPQPAAQPELSKQAVNEQMARGLARHLEIRSATTGEGLDTVRRGGAADSRTQDTRSWDFLAVPQQELADRNTGAGNPVYVLFIVSPAGEQAEAAPTSPPAEDRPQ